MSKGVEQSEREQDERLVPRMRKPARDLEDDVESPRQHAFPSHLFFVFFARRGHAFRCSVPRQLILRRQ
ncbi:hypothetical protein MRX96_050053 [Rhipicephalus microplus]